MKSYILIFLLLWVTFCLSAQNSKQRAWLKEQGFDLGRISYKTSDINNLIFILAIKQSYPDKVKNLSYQNNDWLVEFDGGYQLYWAEGKFLPLKELGNKEKFNRYYNYRYQPQIPNPANYSKEQIERFKKMNEKRPAPSPNNSPRPTHQGDYYKVLYGGITHDTVSPHIVRVGFLGYNFYIHTLALHPLQRVESRLKNQYGKELEAFKSSLNYVAAFFWRNIKNSNNLSYHSFGVAIDMLPTLRNKALYWLWTQELNPNWATVPLKDRWLIPDKFVQVFEEEGFAWGGKWPLYDNMHFEYRPEIRKAYLLQEEYKLL